MGWGTVELEPEVREWLERLSTEQFATAAFYIDLLAGQGALLGEPYTRQLNGKLRELRFHVDRRAVRVTYWIASGRRIVLLTVFVKSRMREVERSRGFGGRWLDVCPRSTRWRRATTMAERESWAGMRERRMAEPGAAEAYEAARLAFELGAAVRELRLARQWSQAELAAAAGMTQSAVARFEAGGTTPTLPVLSRIAHALDADLTVRVSPRTGAA